MSKQAMGEMEHPPLFPARVSIPSGVPGIELVHFGEWYVEDGLPSDGSWSVTHVASNGALQRCHFRTLHAAAYYAFRIRELADWELPWDELKELVVADDGLLSKAMRHAEAHAGEIDAVYPVGAWIPMENGPALLDDDGATRRYMRGAPSVIWQKDEEGKHRCPTCGADPLVVYEWMDA